MEGGVGVGRRWWFLAVLAGGSPVTEGDQGERGDGWRLSVVVVIYRRGRDSGDRSGAGAKSPVGVDGGGWLCMVGLADWSRRWRGEAQRLATAALAQDFPEEEDERGNRVREGSPALGWPAAAIDADGEERRGEE